MQIRRTLGAVAVLAVLLAACGGSSSNKTQTQTPASTPASTTPGETAVSPGAGTVPGHVAIPVGATPSESAKMICSEAVKDINQTIGINATVSTPTWVDHVYSCDYKYPGGATMKLAVKELSNADETTAYYNQLAQQLGKTKAQEGLGQDAFLTKNGSVVVRKDYKVLLVDVSKLPASFGDPPDTRADDAINVAFVVMGCWTGA